MSGLRNYEQWHHAYDDPNSGLSWRLRTVQGFIHRALEEQPGPMRIVSACSGDGRDILGVLAQRADAPRVSATLIELHPTIAGRAEQAAASVAANVEVRRLDAGVTDAYLGAVPADLVLLVGIFGNITDEDLIRTIDATPQLCRPGATLVWSRGRRPRDPNHEIRSRFTAARFAELEYATLDTDSWPAVAATRYEGPLTPLANGQRLFTFVR